MPYKPLAEEETRRLTDIINQLRERATLISRSIANIEHHIQQGNWYMDQDKFSELIICARKTAAVDNERSNTTINEVHKARKIRKEVHKHEARTKRL